MSQMLLVNPRKRKTRKRRTAAQKRATKRMIAANRRRKNPTRRKAARKTTRRRRRSNPTLNMRSVQRQVTDGAIGAVGALGLDVVQGYLPIPANLKGGLVGTGVKALLAIGMGVVASKTKLVNYATAGKMANGALTVVLHDELKKQVATFAPGIQLGEYMDGGIGYYGSGYNAGVIDDPDAMGTYLPSLESENLSMDQMGLGEYIDDLSYH